MGISEREHHIKVLKNLLSHYKSIEKCEGYYGGTLKDNVAALQYAISSLKTDLKYDLMYEGEDIYTKADMVAMLKELKQTIDSKEVQGEELFNDEDRYGYEQGYKLSDDDTCKIIQQKINALRGTDE